MTVVATAGATFVAELRGAPSGLVGQVGLRIDLRGVVKVARSTSAIAAGALVDQYLATRTAPVEPETYVLTWDIGGAAPRFAAEHLVVLASGDPGGIRPPIQQVADLMFSRTSEDDSGDAAGSFDEITRPDADLVDRLIVQAAGELQDAIGSEIPPEKWDEARRVAAFRTAGLIVLSLDDDSTEVSAQRRYDAAWLDGRDRLIAAINPQRWIPRFT